MELNNYGVKLKRLTKDKIEMVRNWRNDPKISQHMEYQDYITPEMQEKWFARIDNDNNYFFIIEVDNKEIGLINIKDIDTKEGTGEAGSFIYDDEYLNSIVPFCTALSLMDFGYDSLLLKYVYIHVLKTNLRAIKFNKYLGYTIEEGQEHILNQLYTVTKENYRENKKKIIKLLRL